MADPSKTTSPFSLNLPAPSGGSTSIFGQKSTSDASKQGGGLFGSGTNPPATSASNVFGSTSTPSGVSSGFGSGNKPSTGFNFSFNQTQSNNSSSGNASSEQTNSQDYQPSNSAPSSTPFSSFATPNKSSNMFANSTTPAGPPPSGGTGTGPGMFGKPPQTAGNLFANLNTTSSAPGTTSTTAPSGNQAQSFFASTPNHGGSNMFGQSPTQSSGGLFSNLNKTGQSGENKITTNQQQNEPPKSMFNLGGQLSANTSITQSTNGSVFSSLTKPASSGTSAPSTTAPSSNMFANLGKSQEPHALSSTAPSSNVFANLATTQGASAPPTTASLGGIFASAAKSQDKDKAPATSAGITSTSASSNSASAPILNPFAPKPVDKAPTFQASNQATATGTAQGTGGATNLGASTAGPAPPAQSRLKNKSMDDIITRWAADLSKCQKEFQQQAQKVAAWDRMLVENSENIQKLYGSTLEAERATTEVERQLIAVENDQAELSMWLDHYEREVDSMMSSSVGQGDTLSGPDQERERTYQLASKLQDRLDEMGKDLTGMIEEINDASSTLSKNNKPDDPLSQVVRVLNSHLTQLQQIDQGAAALQAKVKEAQRAGHSISPSNGLSGPTSDAADGFYRSFMGRR